MIYKRNDFPIFQYNVNGKELIYFDNAATSQKPKQVVDSINEFYTKHNANVHRGIYSFAEYATTLFDQARRKVSQFINADFNEVIFTSGTTQSINFVVLSWAEKFIKEGDEIIISQMEHHSNLIPWYELAKRKNIILKIIPVTNDGLLDLNSFINLLSEKTKLVAITHISNVLGTVNDIEFITRKSQEYGAKVLIDAAQSIAHKKVDVKKINCDFLVFSAHKMLGPTGIGILYINQKLHGEIEPIIFGGGMIYEFGSKIYWKEMPYKFEAGTPPIAQAIGFAQAIDYLNNNINFEELERYESKLCSLLIDGLSKLDQIKILGPLDQLKKTGHMVSFKIKNIHSHDIAAYLDYNGICVRAGHHCAYPLHEVLGIESSIRVSFYFYNNENEVQFLIDLLEKIINK